jgi:sigma-B regulation protein RsbU (phosphoserine phosphatase)
MRSGLFLLLFCASAFAQVYEAKNCVYREGDDPAWARTDYDDSTWQRTPPDAFRTTTHSAYRWTRCRIEMPRLSAPGPLYLQINFASAWIAWVNGRRVGAFGDPKTGQFTVDTMRELRVPNSAISGGELKVSIRSTQRYMNPGIAVGVPELASWSLAAGGRSDLEVRAARRRIEGFSGALPSLVPAMANLGLTVVLLILTVSGSTRRDALLLGALSLSQTAVTLSQATLSMSGAPVALHAAIFQTMRPLALLIPFFAHFMLGRTAPRLFRYIGAAICAYYAVRLMAIFAPVAYAFTLWSELNGPAMALFIALLWLLISAGDITAFLPWRRYTLVERLMLIPNTMMLGATLFLIWAAVFEPTLVSFGNSVALVILMMFNLFYTVVIALRFRRVDDEHQSLKHEMRSAREVQRRLVPEVTSVPGFHIDAAYLPAQEVGGDFYQLLPADDGSLLVVVGDVSGKGLDAAMVVAAAVGALAHLSSRRPEDVLDHLNRSLIGKTRGGFVTCCCALFRADGAVEIANAGHIPPYMEGREMDLPAGPPLGIIEGVCYESTTFSSGTGAITFFSDGVVEATNGTGELLGFDRLAGLSVKPAREIAAEAERWGQEDDITVLQVAYA